MQVAAKMGDSVQFLKVDTEVRPLAKPLALRAPVEERRLSCRKGTVVIAAPEGWRALCRVFSTAHTAAAPDCACGAAVQEEEDLATQLQIHALPTLVFVPAKADKQALARSAFAINAPQRVLRAAWFLLLFRSSGFPLRPSCCHVLFVPTFPKLASPAEDRGSALRRGDRGHHQDEAAVSKTRRGGRRSLIA